MEPSTGSDDAEWSARSPGKQTALAMYQGKKFLEAVKNHYEKTPLVYNDLLQLLRGLSGARQESYLNMTAEVYNLFGVHSVAFPLQEFLIEMVEEMEDTKHAESLVNSALNCVADPSRTHPTAETSDEQRIEGNIVMKAIEIINNFPKEIIDSVLWEGFTELFPPENYKLVEHYMNIGGISRFDTIEGKQFMKYVEEHFEDKPLVYKRYVELVDKFELNRIERERYAYLNIEKTLKNAPQYLLLWLREFVPTLMSTNPFDTSATGGYHPKLYRGGDGQQIQLL